MSRLFLFSYWGRKRIWGFQKGRGRVREKFPERPEVGILSAYGRISLCQTQDIVFFLLTERGWFATIEETLR